MKTPLKGIVFDLDGTLVNSMGITFEAFNHGITRHGGKPHTPEEIVKYFGPGEKEIFGMILGQELAESAYQSAYEFMEENLPNLPLFEGALELLDWAKSEEIPVSIFTGRNWHTTELILDHHGIKDRFVAIVANDHVERPKPSADGLHLATFQMGLSPKDVLFVGDSKMDIIAAKEAGSQSVAALWDPLVSRSGLESHAPDHWAEHPRHVREVWLMTNHS